MSSRVAGSRSVVLTAVLAVLLMPAEVSASPAHAADPIALTGSDHLTEEDFGVGGCAWDPIWTQAVPATGLFTSGVAKDYESTLAVDPIDSRRMTAVWLQDDGRRVGSATSLDGGETWSHEIVPEVTACSGGIHQTSYDTRVVIGPATSGPSRAYVISTSQNQPFPDPRAFLTHIGVSTKSLDGSEWSKPVIVDRSGSIDYPVIAADPVRSDLVYVMWSKRGADATFFSASRDGGASWTPPSLVRVTPPGHLSLSELIVLRNGDLATISAEYQVSAVLDAVAGTTSSARVYVARSKDRGASWSQPELLAETAGVGSWSLAEAGDALFATWTELSEGGWTTVIARENEAGWSEVASFADGDTFVAELAAMPDGTLGLTRYQRRSDPLIQDGKALTYAVLSHSHDAGSTWESVDLSPGFDTSHAGVFLGDHGSIEGSDCGFAATFAGGPGMATHGFTDIFFSRVHISTAPQGACRSHAGDRS
ncbi:MAG TPA: sialidase family protein [Actinomycetota bacterium]|nr:sialidase family protein [Actinomycetota bacterium]